MVGTCPLAHSKTSYQMQIHSMRSKVAYRNWKSWALNFWKDSICYHIFLSKYQTVFTVRIHCGMSSPLQSLSTHSIILPASTAKFQLYSGILASNFNHFPFGTPSSPHTYPLILLSLSSKF